MRIPEKPPSDEELQPIMLGKEGIINFEDLRPFLDIVNTNYLHWDELQNDDRFKGVDLKRLWCYVRLSREFNIRLIKLDGTVLRYIQTPQIEKMLHSLDFRAGGKIGLEGQTPELTVQKKYLVNSLMEEAIASSQLEGAATTRLVAKKMLREKRKPRTHSEKMIVNNYVTMNYIRENTKQNDKLTPGLIKELHKRITRDTLEDDAYEGAFRDTNEVKVFARDDYTTPIYEPPDYNKINILIDQVCNFANTEPKDYYLHPVIKAIILHYLIGYIHPFNDGNGRTARALFYWYLISQNYDYFEYISASRVIKDAPAQYMRAYLYSESDNNDITYFVKFNLHALDQAVTLFEKYVEKTKAENRKVLETIKHNPKLNFRQADILISLSKNEKPITITEMRERYKVTYQTARTDLLNLEKQGYLHMLLRGKQFIFVLDKEKCVGG